MPQTLFSSINIIVLIKKKAVDLCQYGFLEMSDCGNSVVTEFVTDFVK